MVINASPQLRRFIHNYTLLFIPHSKGGNENSWKKTHVRRHSFIHNFLLLVIPTIKVVMKFHERRRFVQRQISLPRALLKTLISKLDIDLQPLSLFISAHQVPNMKHAIKSIKLCHCILSTCYLSTRDQFIN